MGERVVASYCTTFLKREMLHIYRQVSALDNYRTFVMTKALQNSDRFPFSDIELIPQPHMNPAAARLAEVCRAQAADRLSRRIPDAGFLLERRGADVMHIYFGHTGVHLLPFHQSAGINLALFRSTAPMSP